MLASPGMPYLSEVAPVVVYQHAGGVLVRGEYEGAEKRGVGQPDLHIGGNHPGAHRASVACPAPSGAGK
jgi:hypothetical protein